MKKTLAILLALILTLGAASALAESLPIIATANPHYEILELVRDDLAALGFELELGAPCNDYTTENPSTAAGDTLANFFQHIPYLNQYNESVDADKQLDIEILQTGADVLAPEPETLSPEADPGIIPMAENVLPEEECMHVQ